MEERPAAAPVALADLVARFGGSLSGDGARGVRGFAPLETAARDQLAFLANPRYRQKLVETEAAAVLMTAADATAPRAAGVAAWVHPQPYVQFARVAQWFAAQARPPRQPGIHAGAVVAATATVPASAEIAPTAVIEAGAVLGENVSVGPGTVVGRGCVIGADTVLMARVTLYPEVVVGERCIIHGGAVLGADGFGFARDGSSWVKIPQTGTVRIGDEVEIGANTTIDRGALGDTVVGRGTKLDNQIQIGHNVRIGPDCVVAGCVGIAGSAVIGARCMIGGAAMILGHLSLCDDVVISPGTFIARSIRKAGVYTGYYPAEENARWEKNAAVVRHLDALRDRVRALERQLKNRQDDA